MSEWLEHMPAIPLARGVPVVRGVLHSVVTSSEPLRLNGAIATVDPAWRVDLDDAGGFAYALRWILNSRYRRTAEDGVLDNHPYFYRPDCPVGAADAWKIFKYRALVGKSTDEDRVALAKALEKALQEVRP